MLFEAFQPTCETHPVIVVIFMALRTANYNLAHHAFAIHIIYSSDKKVDNHNY